MSSLTVQWGWMVNANLKNENTHSLLLCPWLRLQHAPTISSRFSQIYSKLAKASHEKGSYTMSNILYQESYKPPNFALSCQPMFRLVQFEPVLLVLFRFVVCRLLFSKASIHLSLSLSPSLSLFETGSTKLKLLMMNCSLDLLGNVSRKLLFVQLFKRLN